MNELIDALTKVATQLRKAGVAYVVIGGQAVIQHGEPRFTQDVDFTLGVDPQDAERIINLLREVDFDPAVQQPTDFVKRTHVLPLRSKSGSALIDLTFTDSDYELKAIERGIEVKVAQTLVRFLTPEDLLIHKLIAGRPLDLTDAASVIQKNSGLDYQYIKQWLTQFAEVIEQPLIERLERLLEDTK